MGYVKMNLSTFIRMSRFLIVLSCGLSVVNLADVEEQKNNNQKRGNGSRIVARHLYLPSDEPDFVLPEVIDNRVRNSIFRPLTTPNVILAPSIELIRSPFQRDGYRYIPPVTKQATTMSAAKFQRDEVDTSSHVRISSMSCRNIDDEIFFRASLLSPKLFDYPVIEGATSDLCKIIKINDEYRFDLRNELFWNCGVHDCSTDNGRFYCLNLRFPAISGLKVKDDIKVLLRCRTQEKITSHVKRINLKTLDTSARMAPRVATGGHKNAFETEVGLYRKTLGSDHQFDVKIQPGGAVILGEEILLRAAIREGDGWKYSRISDVTVHYVENNRQKKIMNSMWILDSSGCLNPDVHEICSREQYRVTPLESYLIFQAFMFDNMKETDEMIMNVKVTGCLDGSDCILNCPGGHVRKSRSLNNIHNQTIDWLDGISFRVIKPIEVEKRNFSKSNHMIIPYILSAFILLAIIALLYTINILYKQKNRKSQNF
ncbi:hypothetical protein PV326_012898 [Microctonus aethiopoides]|nr:hypothetical protein PV326_012898 [Microctonus aethiopoides]